jgi:hypothetical protein
MCGHGPFDGIGELGTQLFDESIGQKPVQERALSYIDALDYDAIHLTVL